MAAMEAETAPLTLESLPTDPLLLILSFLDYRDLINCCYVSRRLSQLSSHDPLWRRHCKKYWLISEEEKTQKNQCWKSLFIDTYSDVGRYIDHYAAIKKAWDDLKKYLEPRCPRMVLSLKEGAREEDLDAVEAQIGCKLPDDYRCSYRIHNGQKLVVPGLLGSMALSNHYRSEDLLDVDTAAGGFQQRQGLKYCLPLTFCIHTGLSQYIAVEAAEGRNKNEVFYQCPDQMARNPAAIDMFIIGATFTDWFTSYVNNVVSGGFPIIRDQIFRYIHDPECVATTGDITVSVSTSFLPELSSVHPPHYFFTYRIRIEMSKDALPEKACQLDSRYWRITNAKGDVEEVQGPGVVGEFPIISPGRVYEYTSCTTFSTTSGYMEGYYTFHFLYFKDKIFNVAIPRFHMACPTFRVSVARLLEETNCNKYTLCTYKCYGEKSERKESGVACWVLM
ncbi:F-box only protein 3 isoform X2 [Oryctolagus cuniculus]|uniref:F-box only protein 3 isoform X2 n=1 Tax=Oryctolagus cuniculus TaxID=9986 RepID=UPI0007EE35FD|nr:F-box only protein 3 isoform X2 [Oryctolagus cuniculus]